MYTLLRCHPELDEGQGQLHRETNFEIKFHQLDRDFMKNRLLAMALLLSLVIGATSCQRNYYSGTGKGSKCGCPGNVR